MEIELSNCGAHEFADSCFCTWKVLGLAKTAKGSKVTFIIPSAQTLKKTLHLESYRQLGNAIVV